MWTNPQETADLFAFTKEILNGKLHFFVQWLMHCSLKIPKIYKRNAIARDRNRAGNISVLTDKIPKIRKKFWMLTLYKKWSFPVRFSLVNVTSFLRIWLHLLKKSLMENFIFYAVRPNIWNAIPIISFLRRY